nr:hypothetical protein [Tanacetum cinerariifolium]
MNVGPKRIALKIYLQKAYDTVNLNFVEDILRGFGFHVRMVEWIMKCITFTSFYISVNGESCGYFKGGRDDLLMFCHGDVEFVRVIKETIEEFGNVSGLIPNYSKSIVIFGGINEEESTNILNVRFIYARLKANLAIRAFMMENNGQWPDEWSYKFPMIYHLPAITLVQDKADTLLWKRIDGFLEMYHKVGGQYCDDEWSGRAWFWLDQWALSTGFNKDHCQGGIDGEAMVFGALGEHMRIVEMTTPPVISSWDSIKGNLSLSGMFSVSRYRTR